jgi:8-oxo-dGTP pyrophosphatase MutT (NUDIX family)
MAEVIPTWFFALVVVRHDDRFVLLRERKHEQLWYLPAGRVEAGESLIAAAVRETREEAGLDVRLTGLLRLEHTPFPKHTRVRAIFLAEPAGDTSLKQEPDDESQTANWVGLNELPGYALRDPALHDLFRYVVEGGRTYPLSVLGADE